MDEHKDNRDFANSHSGTSGNSGNNGPQMEPLHDTLERLRTTQSVVMSPEMFEKLYLQPQPNVKGNLVRTFGNPTPLAITGFVIGLTPLSMILMEWRGSGALGAGMMGCFWFIAGPALWIGGILEFFLGNTFSFVVFMIYGGVFFAWAVELTPRFAATDAYDTQGHNFFVGQTEPSFAASLAFFILVVGILSFVYMICALRVNLVFFLVFLTASLGFLLLAGSFFQLANGRAALALTLQKGCGGSWFVASLLGWYLIFVLMFDSVGFKFPLPVGDFTSFWAKRDNAAKEKKEANGQV